ncbi:methyltransferase [Kitasatospora xanthocidica]|uniref:class I SAM-dependent methyltransferase n=1 Tax=Kitasatospora xanthocidica TaxID=83382 RepID=UPI001673AA76|nr:class I SAM-dependent methyltransferase [Kitasatospora xanthocidica]GHF66448.1 methyltransferase [Kitasatospora xanthocidica]
MLDYDREAREYDASRGGEARAEAAATAVERLLPADTRTVLDVACGTGIVTARLLRPGRTVLGIDRSPGMLRLAERRLARRGPAGAVARADATRLPVRTGGADAVVLIWLLHLLPSAGPVLAEARRVLRPGGALITTVDKNAAAFTEPSDLAELTAPLRRRHAPRATDDADRLTRQAAALGLHPAGGTAFTGAGQGRSPRAWREAVERGRIPWCADPADAAATVRALAALPEQDAPRPDPRYRLLAFRA